MIFFIKPKAKIFSNFSHSFHVVINPYSKISLWFCFVLMIWTGFFFYPRWNQSKTESTISWDVSGYYMYLPAIFIYHDLKEFGFLDSMIQKYGPTPDPQQIHVTQEGKKVLKYSGGQALMMAPFFFIAHGYALLSGQYPADGFSFSVSTWYWIRHVDICFHRALVIAPFSVVHFF